ncbi:pancreatic lipase-related protein 2-like [Bombus pascuorum]|uniref:pancreatic lipase-related protein 2-like n=1 Tax=Bombus pascuorum TaxID=65598 RepID=UPI00298EC06A|nr:pancreatic lipase-related protein 2-like [Bombus pascuorum]
MVNLSLSKLYPTLLATLTYINPILKTDGDGHVTDIQINKDPLPKNLTLDTYLDTISFKLFTQDNPTNGDIIKLNDVESVRNSHWNASRQTIIITHGWTNSGESPSCTTIRDGFLKVRDCNVIILDWSEIACDLVYSVVADIVPYVAQRAASFINFMRIEAGLQTSNLKIVGHSFGAQIAGLSAREVGKSSRVAEVIALDPANVMFQLKKPGERLDKSDAENVQIIHTCAGQFGYYLSVGTSDFYANDGRHQPGCGIDLLGICAHLRSYKFFAESITNPKGFLGTRADGATAYMGGATIDPNAKGTYYFKTNSQYPYALDG